MTADKLEVAQSDREAAAANIKRRLVWQHGGEQPWMDAATASMRMGEQDDHDEVQAFARHRLAERERCAGVAQDACTDARKALDAAVRDNDRTACVANAQGQIVAGAITLAIRYSDNAE